MAHRFFFETLVRVHRTGEAASFLYDSTTIAPHGHFEEREVPSLMNRVQ